MSLLGYLLAAAFTSVLFLVVSLMLTFIRAIEVVVAGTVVLVRLVEPLRRDECIP